MPLLVRGGGFDHAAVVADPVGLIDLAPTMFEAAGVAIPNWIEGRPLTARPRDFVLTENDHEAGFRVSLRTITTERYKLTRYVGREGMGELYDLQDDPHELVNMWPRRESWQLRRELLARLDAATNRAVRSAPRVSLIG